MVYKLQQDAFDIIDTEEKAYWIGFLWCDGYVLDRRPKGKHEISIKLQLGIIDKSHLIKFKQFLGSEHPIKEYKGGSYSPDKKTVRLMFSNRHMGEVLINRYGLVPYRTKINSLVDNIPEHLIRHFIRGVFDAEGSASVYYNKGTQLKAICSFTSLEALIIWIQDFLLSKKIVNSKTKLDKRHKDRDSNDNCLNISGTRQCLRFLEWLYYDSTIFMDRKYDKYLELKSKLGEC